MVRKRFSITIWSRSAPQTPRSGSSPKGLTRQGPWKHLRQLRPLLVKAQRGKLFFVALPEEAFSPFMGGEDQFGGSVECALAMNSFHIRSALSIEFGVEGLGQAPAGDEVKPREAPPPGSGDLALGDLLGVDEEEGVGGTALHAGRGVHPLAEVALQDLPEGSERLRRPEGADHDAHPAADAPLIMDEDQAFGVPVEGRRRAGVQAGRILAVAALNGKPVLPSRGLDPDPGLGRHLFIEGFRKPPAQARPVQGAGHLAGFACDASFCVDEDRFHMPPDETF